MKITIDTKEDSPEDIRKAIQLLSSVIKQEPVEAMPPKHRDIFESSTQIEGSVFGNLFNEPEKKDEKREKIQIIPY